MKYFIIGVLVLIIIVLFILFYKNKKNVNNIEDIKQLHFSYSTGYHHNASIDYEIVCDSECKLYFKDDGVSYEDRKEYKIDKDILKEIEDKLNEYEVINWNNYNKSSQDVLDGNSFSINIKYKDDESISAHGYESWPKNYREVRSYLDNTFSKYINK